MYLGTRGDHFNGGALILDQHIVNEHKFEDTGNVRVELIVLAFTGKDNVEPFVTWSRWVTFGKDKYAEAGDPALIKVADDCAHGHYHRTIMEAVKEYEERVEAITHEKQDRETIRVRGENDGKTAASWLVDGNTPEPEAVLNRLIRGIFEGDPEILDALPSPRLGGEFAGEQTWEEICQEEVGHYGDDGEQDLLLVYEEAFGDGVQAEIHRMRDEYSSTIS